MDIRGMIGGLGMLKGLTNTGSSKPNVIRTLIENPERFKMEAFIEGDEITIRIRKRRKPAAGYLPKPTKERRV